jgi:glycosyltransferase involved in cell wall biosynthesis
MSLKLAFLDNTRGDYTPLTPETAPLGGTESALCYLALALVRAGAAVTIVNGTTTPGMVGGVRCVSHQAMSSEALRGFDAVVVSGGCDTASAQLLRSLLDAGQRLVFWTQHAVDQPAVANLSDPAMRRLWDGFAFVSRWQRDEYVRRFGIARRRSRILRNAAAPCFGGLFPSGGPAIRDAKPWPPVLAYTSTPFRGLDVLLDAMPRIRATIPGTRLQVYSSLEVYRVPLARDPYAALYDRCRRTDGVDYVGGLPQPALAGALRRVTCLAYPNRFAETSCIAVIEAMAAGCLVVTSQLGALPETTAGFARLLPVPADPGEHAIRFADAVCDALARWQAEPATTERLLRAQIEHCDAGAAWDQRARLWLAWLGGLKVAAAAPDRLESVAELLVRLRGCLHLGDQDEARILCERILAFEPAHAVIWRILVQIDISLARFTDAAIDLARAHRLGAPFSAAELGEGALRIMAGIESGGDGRPLADRVKATTLLADVLIGNSLSTPTAEGLVALGRRLASEAQLGGDHAAAYASLQIIRDLRPKEPGVQIAMGWMLNRLGRFAEALGMIRDALALGPGDLLDRGDGRAIVAQCQEDAETILLQTVATVAPTDAMALSTALVEVAALIGEEPGWAKEARAAAAGLPDPAARSRLEVAALCLLAARRGRQGRRPEQVELLRQAVQRGGGAVARTALRSARMALAQRLLLESLHSVLEDGVNGRHHGMDPVAWQAEAQGLVAVIEQSLCLEGNDEAERSRIWGTLRGHDAFLAHFQATGAGAPPLPAAGGYRRRVYDCFQFYNELDLLELRLAELDPVVDHFVLVEATTTHAGTPKPLHYWENRQRFADHADKIIHVVVEDDPGGFSWKREAHQREAIARGLTGCDARDLVIIGDADEILRSDIVERMRDADSPRQGLFAPQLDIFLYFLNLRSRDPWISVAAASCELVRQVGPNRMRYLVKQGIGETIADAGWHFTWMGGVDRFLAKLDAFAHREMMVGFNHDPEANRKRLEQFFATGSFGAGPVPGMWTKLTRTPLDDRFPVWLRANRERFERQGWIVPGTE